MTPDAPRMSDLEPAVRAIVAAALAAERAAAARDGSDNIRPGDAATSFPARRRSTPKVPA